MLTLEEDANDKCRGGGVEDVWAACAERTEYVDCLHALGMCYEQTGRGRISDAVAPMRTDLDEVACRDQGQPSPLGNPPRAVIIFLMLAIFFVLAGGGRWTHY